MREDDEDLKKVSDAFISLYKMLKILRSPEGCPWDREQTLQSIRMYILEEAHEVVDAVEREDSDGICEELGDLLFMVLFMAIIQEERGDFTAHDVLTKVGQKMLRRHPHVFGDQKVMSKDQVVESWKKIKKNEGKERQKTTSSLPGLMMANRILSELGGEKEDVQKIYRSLYDLLDELKGISNGELRDGDMARNIMGEILIQMVRLARSMGLNAEDVIRTKIRKMMDHYKAQFM